MSALLASLDRVLCRAEKPLRSSCSRFLSRMTFRTFGTRRRGQDQIITASLFGMRAYRPPFQPPTFVKAGSNKGCPALRHATVGGLGA